MAKQSAEKLKRLREKAEELFWKYGYNGVSVDQIANEAGISKMTVYKHFPSKEDLFIEVLTNYSNYHTNKIMEVLGENNHTFEKIEFLYSYSLQLSSQLPAILIKDIMDRSNVMNKLKAIKEEKSIAMWRYVLEDGMQKGEIRPLDMDFVSNLLFHMANIFAAKTEFYFDENKRKKLYESFFDFLKYGLLGNNENSDHFGEKERVGYVKKCTDADPKSV